MWIQFNLNGMLLKLKINNYKNNNEYVDISF